MRSEVKNGRKVGNPLCYSLNMGCLVNTSLAKTLLREKRPGEEKEYTQGYKYFDVLEYMFLTKVELEMGHIPCIGYFFPR